MSTIKEFALSLAPETILFGDKAFAQETVKLRAGDLSMLLINGTLRYISVAGKEIIRLIFPAVRDRDWLTVEPEITYTTKEIRDDSFLVEFNALYRSERVNFKASYSFEGKSDNTLLLKMEGEALDAFEKNRIGFCVLHPAAAYSGRECQVTHSDGKLESCIFPALIAPSQPFIDIISMNWELENISAGITFYGDVFEIEDQRNWGDSTYKIYSTPLSLPYPVKLAAGSQMAQLIELWAAAEATAANRVDPGSLFPGNPATTEAGTSSSAESDGDMAVRLAVNANEKVPFSPVGLGMSSRNTIMTPSEADIIRSLGISHLRIELVMQDESWRDRAIRGTTEAKLLGCPAEFVLILDDDAMGQVVKFIEFSEDEHPETALITVLTTSGEATPDWLADAVLPILKNAFPELRVGVGTNANFAELNRSRPATVHADVLSWALHPQEHASDLLTLTENLNAQAAGLESARSFADEKDVWISPVTMQRRFNANVSGFELPHTGSGMPPAVDPRMMSLYGACWTAGSLKHILETGAGAVTYYETVGERGLMQGESATAWPGSFRSCSNMVFPLFHVFRFLLNYRNNRIVKCSSSSPLEAEMLAVETGDDIKIIIFNYTTSSRKVSLDNITKIKVKRLLSADSFPDAVSDPDWIAAGGEDEQDAGEIILPPCSVLFASAKI